MITIFVDKNINATYILMQISLLFNNLVFHLDP